MEIAELKINTDAIKGSTLDALNVSCQEYDQFMDNYICKKIEFKGESIKLMIWLYENLDKQLFLKMVLTHALVGFTQIEKDMEAWVNQHNKELRGIH